MTSNLNIDFQIGKRYSIFYSDNHENFLFSDCFIYNISTEYIEIVFPYITKNIDTNDTIIKYDKSNIVNNTIFNVFGIYHQKGLNYPFVNPVTKLELYNLCENLPYQINTNLYLKKLYTITISELIKKIEKNK
jgi:hypothetical protein